MSDIDKVHGELNRPFGPDPEKGDEKVDPERFKKMIRIDESEQTSKRRKRKMQEEEVEDEGTNTQTEEEPAGDFASCMQEEGQGLFDLSSSSQNVPPPPPQNLAPLPDDPPPIPTDEVEEEEPLPVDSYPASPSSTPVPYTPSSMTTSPPPPVHQNSSASIGAYETQGPPSPVPSPSLQEQQQSALQAQSETPDLAYRSNNPPPKRKPPTDESLMTEQAQLKDLKKKIKRKKRATPTSSQTDQVSASKTSASSNRESTATNVPAHQMTTAEEESLAPSEPMQDRSPASLSSMQPLYSGSTFQATTRKERRKQTVSSPHTRSSTPSITSGSPLNPSPSSESASSRPFDEASPETAGLLPIGLPTSPLASATRSFAPTPLSQTTYELFQKLSGFITLQQESGLSTFSVTLAMPGSALDGSQVVLTHYDTAPNLFNIELSGSPEAVALFNTSMPGLETYFKERTFNFEVNLLPPSLQTSTPKKRRVQRKSPPREENDSAQH